MISIWEKETFFAPQDVIIIGSGFVGLWSAFHLKRKYPKVKVTILERGIIPTGASSRNAGFACFGSLSELIYDGRSMGTENMLKLVEMRYKGLEKITKYFKPDKIDYETCGGYELYDDVKLSTDELKNNIAYINALLKPITGSKKTYALDDENISTFGFGKTTHMVSNHLEGYLHSGKLLQQLTSTIQGMGVQLLTGIHVKEYVASANGFTVHTTNEIDFHAQKILVCTNAFTRELFPSIDIVPARGQVILTSPIENLPWKGTFHSDEGFYYFRNLGNRVLLGGARNKAFEEEQTTDMTVTPFIQEELKRYLDEVILPAQKGRYEIESRWSGIMAMGSEKMPLVKQLQPGVYCAVRMSGMGVALAPVVSKQVIDMMMRDVTDE